MATKSPAATSAPAGGAEGSRLQGLLPVDLFAILVMAVIGLGISIYLTTVHYANAPLVCSSGGIVSCSEVTRSSYSVVPGTSWPITIPGMLWFVVSGALAAAVLASAGGTTRRAGQTRRRRRRSPGASPGGRHSSPGVSPALSRCFTSSTQSS